MDRKYYYFLPVGLAIGLLFGMMWSDSGNMTLGLGIGALVGLAIGWFAAAGATQVQDKNRKGS